MSTPLAPCVWCAQSGANSLYSDTPNSAVGYYDNNMYAYMDYSVDLSSYRNATLYYYFTAVISSGDCFYLRYHSISGGFCTVNTYTNCNIHQQQDNVSLPNTADTIEFLFVSNGDNNVNYGVYLFNVEIRGTLPNDAGTMADAGDSAGVATPISCPANNYSHYSGYLGQDDDWYSFNVAAGYVRWILVICPTYPSQAQFYMNLTDPNNNVVSTSLGDIQYFIRSAGSWKISISSSLGFGQYSFYIGLSPKLGGCPFVSVWNGSAYAVDNNLLPKSETSNGSDVQDYYRLEQSLVPSHSNPLLSIYSLQISEFEYEHSYIDQVKLYAVDHNPNTNMAVSPTGQMLTYQDPQPPIFAEDQSGRDWLQTLSSIDGDYYQSAPGHFLTFCFGQANTANAKLVLREDLMKDSIHVQLLMTNGSWTEASDIPGRVNWAIDIVNLSPYLQTAWNPLTVRLYFTAYHRIDYV